MKGLFLYILLHVQKLIIYCWNLISSSWLIEPNRLKDSNDLKFKVVMSKQNVAIDLCVSSVSSCWPDALCSVCRSMAQWQRTSLCMMLGSWSRSRVGSCSSWSNETVARSWCASHRWQTLILTTMVSDSWLCYTSRRCEKRLAAATHVDTWTQKNGCLSQKICIWVGQGFVFILVQGSLSLQPFHYRDLLVPNTSTLISGWNTLLMLLQYVSTI